MDDEPLGRRNYEQFARRYAEHASSKPHNAHYERPATLSLLPDVRGRRVLDAGCGPGHYAVELLDRGADLVAADVTPEMVEITREAVGARATVHLADLEQPLTFAADAEFDGVLCALMLDYVAEWAPLLREFFRVLEPGGWLVASHGHPMSDYLLCKDRLATGPRYHDVERFAMEWGGFGEPRPLVHSFRRPLAAMLNPLADAGFVLERVLEPLPTEEYRRADPETHASLMRAPCFLCVRARKPA